MVHHCSFSKWKGELFQTCFWCTVHVRHVLISWSQNSSFTLFHPLQPPPPQTHTQLEDQEHQGHQDPSKTGTINVSPAGGSMQHFLMEANLSRCIYFLHWYHDTILQCRKATCLWVSPVLQCQDFLVIKREVPQCIAFQIGRNTESCWFSNQTACHVNLVQAPAKLALLHPV